MQDKIQLIKLTKTIVRYYTDNLIRIKRKVIQSFIIHKLFKLSFLADLLLESFFVLKKGF
jgi:hypothetical protein